MTPTERNDEIIKTVERIHQQYRQHGSNVPKQTKTALRITAEWQTEVKKSGRRVRVEVPVGTKRKEKIDLVDDERQIARL